MSRSSYDDQPLVYSFRLPRQSYLEPEPQVDNETDYRRKSKKGDKDVKRRDKKEAKEKQKSEHINTTREHSRNPMSLPQLNSFSGQPFDSQSQVTEKDMLNEWQRMRLEVNGRITTSLVDNTYREILLNQRELNKLKGSKAKDSGLSLYKFGVVEDQATCLRFDDFIFFGIPRGSIKYVNERVITENEPLYQQRGEDIGIITLGL